MEKVHDSEDAPKIMSLQLLNEMTNNFSEDRKLGSGTYGEVYKGVRNGEEIAVKMLHLRPGFDDLEEFKKEFENLTKLRHQNIVQLLGYCYEIRYEYVDLGDGRTVFAQNIYRALCFEYMQNGSLQKHLYDEHHGLDWRARYKIIKGICEGLKYLHEGLECPIYHLDLKPDNILLDKNMVPKLADFGLSKLIHTDKTQATQSSIGTMGYLPPEYIEENLVSKKLDIFSLGVVMIRIMAGYDGYYKKAEMSSQEFVDLVHKNWRERLQATSGCTSLEDECHQVRRCIEIALDCVKSDRKQRPEIGTIIHWLSETEHMCEKLATSSPHKTRRDVVSHIHKVFRHYKHKASSVFSDLVDEVSLIAVSATPSQPQKIISVPKGPVEISIETNSSVSAAPSPLQRITSVLKGPGETSTKICSDRSSEISKLLDVHPLELRFPWEPNHDIKCPVTLTNRTDRYVGVWITPVISQDINCDDICFIVGGGEESSPVFQATMEPHSTFAVALKIKSQWEPPTDAVFEVLMVVTGSKGHDKYFDDSSIKSTLNMDSEFLKRVEKLGGEVHRAMLKAVICDPVSCQSVIQNKQFIRAPSELWYIEGIDLHPTETWILARHFRGGVSILNYQTQEIEMVLQVTNTKRIPIKKKKESKKKASSPPPHGNTSFPPPSHVLVNHVTLIQPSLSPKSNGSQSETFMDGSMSIVTLRRTR